MRKVLRLLEWIANDIGEATNRLELVIDEDLSGDDEVKDEEIGINVDTDR